MPTGRVKWYDKTKGYGFIESPEGDVFFHFSDILMEGFKALAEDQRVSYKLVRSNQGLKAREIKPLDNRASVRHAARYRTLIHMIVSEDQSDAFDAFMANVPAWFDSFEQNLGLRRIGTWRNDQYAVHLVESDRPYDQSMEMAKGQPEWNFFADWNDTLRTMLQEDPVQMTPSRDPNEPTIEEINEEDGDEDSATNDEEVTADTEV